MTVSMLGMYVMSYPLNALTKEVYKVVYKITW